MGEYFGKTLVLAQWRARKLSRNGNFLQESPISGFYVPAGFLQAVSTLGSWRPSEATRVGV